MQFYKFEGFTVSENWSEENNDRRVMREKVRKISMKTNSFNQNQQRKAYAFVADASEDTVTIGVIVRNYADVHKLISGYLQTIGLITANKSLTDHVARYFKRFDCIQFDEGNCANNINALQNSDVILIIQPKMTIRILPLTITL